MASMYETSFSFSPSTQDAGYHFLRYLASRLGDESRRDFLNAIKEVKEAGKSLQLDDEINFNGSTIDGSIGFWADNISVTIHDDFSFDGWLNVRRAGAFPFLREVCIPFNGLLDINIVQTSFEYMDAYWSDGKTTVSICDPAIIDADDDDMPMRAFELIQRAYYQALDDIDEAEHDHNDLGYKIDGPKNFLDWARDPSPEDIDNHGDLINRLSENFGDQLRGIPASEIIEAMEADKKESESM